MGKDLHSFLKEHEADHIQVNKPVDLDHIGALVAQAKDTIVFNTINGYGDFRIVDLLFSTRRAQARVLWLRTEKCGSDFGRSRTIRTQTGEDG